MNPAPLSIFIAEKMSNQDHDELTDLAEAELEFFLADWCNRNGVSWSLLCGVLLAKAIRIECEETGQSGPEVMKRIADRVMRRRAEELRMN